jgi:uncharacterized protein YgbK (DUF1537 family)
MLYTFYGDDFTGSTDVLETLARAGVRAALFVAPPSQDDLEHFPGLQALGIAGDSRSRSPQWMSNHLPGIFSALKVIGAPVTHYKTCSTFDSAPHIGSIGRAIEVGREVFRPRFVPIVVGAPHLGRFVHFGNLFATADGAVYRIDRHPTMSRHPVTPMLEADLRLHLRLQTSVSVGLLDGLHLTASALADVLAEGDAAVLFDTFDAASIDAVGALIWRYAEQAPLFAAGSSGLTESLISAWRAGNVIAKTAVVSQASAVEQLLVLSGSCSPATKTQIEWAIANGFDGIRIDADALIANPSGAMDQALQSIRAGRSPVLYTALGALDHSAQPHSAELGAALGILLREIFEQSGLRRAVICGGDTSSHAMQQLPIRALTFAASLTPGVPLCRVHAPGRVVHDAEFALKGGQMGAMDFFALARRGGS